MISLVGTGLATVALGLLAYALAGADAGLVLGAVLAIKMCAYVVLAPIVTAVADRLPRKGFLVAMDLLRVAVAVFLPFVTELWQVFVLIVLLQAASAAFTPTFQATIPLVLPDERDYTRALSLSRLAFDLESLLSPVLAAALLTVTGFSWLFAGTAFGFAASAALVLSVVLPAGTAAKRPGGFYDRTSRGTRIYLATPRLRALVGLNLAAAAAGAMVLVDTVVVIRADLGMSETAVALALGAYGAGSMLAALVLPRVLAAVPDRRLMLAAAVALAGSLVVIACAYTLGPASARWPVILCGWVALGMGYSLVSTPVGRLIRRSGGPGDWPALFAAQFAISHAGWLLTYVLAGGLGAVVGTAPTMLVLGALALGGAVWAARVWPPDDPEHLDHVHAHLTPDHPHLRDAAPVDDGWSHTHSYVIDDEHRAWPVGARR
ncbi:MAG: MFS transporter [Actinomycetota bacterium]|nr:MFS transporter [Actinomycetota bacterium]